MLLPRYRPDQPTPRNLHHHLAQITQRDHHITETVTAGPTSTAAELRGIPAIAEGVAGAQPGTSPHIAILRTNRRRRRTSEVSEVWLRSVRARRQP
jgi:hypothetical protein